MHVARSSGTVLLWAKCQDQYANSVPHLDLVCSYADVLALNKRTEQQEAGIKNCSKANLHRKSPKQSQPVKTNSDLSF